MGGWEVAMDEVPRSLLHIDLTDCSLDDDDAAAALPDFLCAATQLRSVSLSYNGFTAQGFVMVGGSSGNDKLNCLHCRACRN
jgi:hypothetical protein